MQIDMHYYGTYCMARAAGMSRDSAQVAASCAQYVDDNVATRPVAFKDGARLARVPTAHHVADEIKNIQPDDQRNVWVPFHFLPGNEPGANGNSEYEELLKCRKDSEPARFMIEHVVDRAAMDPLALERVGITAHVFADTFSHYGFAGVSSRNNKVAADSFQFPGANPELVEFLNNKRQEFVKRFTDKVPLLREAVERPNWWTSFTAGVKSLFAEGVTGALGHGGVATYPDLPYLVWGFRYESSEAAQRDNPASFLDACAALHDFFTQVLAQRTEFAGGPARPFADIRPAVDRILRLQGGSDARAEAWRKAARDGDLFTAAEEIPPYLGDDWSKWLANADGKVSSEEALDHPACRFHLAANAHRSWVLHDMLPARNLLVA